jgi:hypothetical protein
MILPALFLQVAKNVYEAKADVGLREDFLDGEYLNGCAVDDECLRLLVSEAYKQPPQKLHVSAV